MGIGTDYETQNQPLLNKFAPMIQRQEMHGHTWTSELVEIGLVADGANQILDLRDEEETKPIITKMKENQMPSDDKNPVFVVFNPNDTDADNETEAEANESEMNVNNFEDETEVHNGRKSLVKPTSVTRTIKQFECF